MFLLRYWMPLLVPLIRNSALSSKSFTLPARQMRKVFTSTTLSGGTPKICASSFFGFTTPPQQSRSTTYATDVAKMLQIPIFHVNGEDPEAVAQVVRLAMDFRQEFHRDVVIDMYCFRRRGHNEADEPAFTQPALYRVIERRPSVHESYLEKLLKLGEVAREEAMQIAVEHRAKLDAEQPEPASMRVDDRHPNGNAGDEAEPEVQDHRALGVGRQRGEDVAEAAPGDTPETLEKVAQVYEKIIVPGVHRASSIKAAEAAKVIENTQRDLSIALINELAMIFGKIGIDTTEVLNAASTKWNFLNFRPGLVGGHCIGVDPYYLTHKAEMLGYHPQVILAGRRINDGMAAYIAQQTVKNMINAGVSIKSAAVTVLGLTFKENCPDIRNSKVADVVRELGDYGCNVTVHDPMADPVDAQHEYGITLTAWNDLPLADAMVAAVSHSSLLSTPLDDMLGKIRPGGVFVDVKSVYDANAIRATGRKVWRL